MNIDTTYVQNQAKILAEYEVQRELLQAQRNESKYKAQLAAVSTLDTALKARIAQEIRSKASARHVPNEIYEVAEVPRTLTGKKMEVPVRKLLLGMARDKVASPESMANPSSLEYFVQLAGALNKMKA